MAVEAGQTLLHYRLVEKIGEGGMGVVWRAVDTILDRDVAVKVLPEALVANPDRLARLEREAKLAASLNHPNIATVHGFHEAGVVRFVVMEYVPGDDLAERIARGPLPTDEAFAIARQIAEGLEAAHAAGVLHRDLKPANVKIAPDGRVRVLDFGLARAFEVLSSGTDPAQPTRSPTLTSGGTVDGTILGTAAYMSPEQARGHPVDTRADVWAFGVVLYEMLTGSSAFKGETISDTLASVLKVEPDFAALPAAVPHRIRRLLARCLHKDRRGRLHHIADARIVLEEALAGVPDEEPAERLEELRRRRRERIGWVAAVVVVGLAGVWLGGQARDASDLPGRSRKILLAVEGTDVDSPWVGSPRISPDGRRIVYENEDRLFVRDLEDWDSHEIPAAKDADRWFWSADGTEIGFIVDEVLWRVSADGTGATVISELPGSVAGVAWGDDGYVVIAGEFDDEPSIYRVPERGGEPRPLPLPDDFEGHFHGLDVLPGGQGAVVGWHRNQVMTVAVYADGELNTFAEFKTGYLPNPVYSASGHIVYTRGGSNEGVWAMPFSLDGMKVNGEPFLVVAKGQNATVSDDGILVYSRQSFEDRPRELVWVDRNGARLGSIGDSALGIDAPAISRDGRRIAMSLGSDFSSDRDLWVHDVERGTRSRVSFDEGAEYAPVWSPDGTTLYFRYRGEDGPTTIWRLSIDGNGQPVEVVEGARFSLSADGGSVVFTRTGDDTGSDVWRLELGENAQPIAMIAGPSDETWPRVSPDGRYIAYQSDESGRDEIYVKRFPSGDGKWQVSLEGGRTPRWSPDGDELFWAYDADLMAVDVRTDPSLVLGKPRRLFSWSQTYMLDYVGYDVAPDGERFVLVDYESKDDKQTTANRSVIPMIDNWLVE